MVCEFIIKRSGKRVKFDQKKIYTGLYNALCAAGVDTSEALPLAEQATAYCIDVLEKRGFNCTTAEAIQQLALESLRALPDVGNAVTDVFIEYARKRKNFRDLNKLKQILKDLTETAAKDSNIKRENANIDADTAMGTMLKYGSESSKNYTLSEILPEDIASAHTLGDIHIHDLDFYNLTETCCQINLRKLFKGGFSTGNGKLREPGSIRAAASLACIAIQANQNDQHGGQAVPCFDFYMAPYVTKTCAKIFKRCLADSLAIVCPDITQQTLSKIDEQIMKFTNDENNSFLTDESAIVLLNEIYTLLQSNNIPLSLSQLIMILHRVHTYADEETYQAMEALVGNLNTMNSRAGAQVPFSSLNFGTDTSPEGRCVSKNLMKAFYDGLGEGETPIFPILIFKVKNGINFEKGSPNYDLYRQALQTTAKRLFPNFSFIDAPFNLQYYKEGRPETEAAYMGCRTRVIGNVYDSSREITEGRGNLSFTSINLPRLGILCKQDIPKFFELLDEKLNLVARQLQHRFNIQCCKIVKNYPFLMGQGVWLDSDKLYSNESIADVLRHGTLSIGFIGLAECLTAICGKHHGESEYAQKLGIEIIKHMREFTDLLADETGLNWSLLATPAEGLSGRFVKLDRELFGIIRGVTDKEWYTNSFHLPVEFEISAYKKIEIEGVYHKYTNGGHITYVELNGDPSKNIEALDALAHHMQKCGIGYGAINHPVDRDSVCGYIGVIEDKCPMCQREEGEMASAELLKSIKNLPSSHYFDAFERGKGVGFQRIRRITGYLVGTIDRFNDAKREELKHRYKHM